MKYLLILTSYLLVVLSSVQSLVHYIKLEGTDKGCKAPEGVIAVGDVLKHPKVCGVYVCQNKEGDALIHYCQIPATFADCPRGETGVSTVLPFPQCCWICVKYKDCDKEKRSSKGPTPTTKY